MRLHHRAKGDADRQARLKKLAASQVDMLSRYSFLAGGWGYYDFEYGTQIPGDASNSFVTATVLIALHEAKSIGIEFPERLTKKADRLDPSPAVSRFHLRLRRVSGARCRCT